MLENALFFGKSGKIASALGLCPQTPVGLRRLGLHQPPPLPASPPPPPRLKPLVTPLARVYCQISKSKPKMMLVWNVILRSTVLHLIESTFNRKRIYANPSSYPNPNSSSNPNTSPNCNSKSNPNPKAQLCFRTAKWRHFSIKCTDTVILMSLH